MTKNKVTMASASSNAGAGQGNDFHMGDGVKEAQWGQRSIRFYDLDGHMIEVHTFYS